MPAVQKTEIQGLAVSPESDPEKRPQHFFNSLKGKIMNLMKLKDKAKYALAATTVAVLSSPVLAEGTLMDTAKEELSGLKAGVLAIGAIAIGIAVAFATIAISKRGARSAS